MLNLDWVTIASQIINFLVFAGALYYLLFRPMMSRIKERRAERERLMQELQEKREETERLRAELEEQLANAEERANEIIEEAQRQREAERQEMLEEVEQEVERTLADARSDVQQMRQQAVDAFHDELIDAILAISAQVIHQTAPDEMHDTLVKQLGERIWEMGRSEMERVRTFRQSLGERTPTARVITAHPLSGQQQGELARTLTALADRNVDIQMRTNPSLGAGMRVRLGDIVVDNSVAGHLEELREDASEALKQRLTDEQSEQSE